MVQRLYSLLGVTHRDARRVLVVAAMFFILLCGLAMGRSATDAFFIKSAGTQYIPYMYVINAFAMVLVSYMYSRLEKLVSRYRLFHYILYFLILTLALLRLLVALWQPLPVAIPFGLYAFYETALLILMMHFWTFANDLFDPREGKRLFPLIGGAGLAGLIVGGVLTTVIAPLIGTVNLFSLWVLFLATGIPFLWWVKSIAAAEQLSLDNVPGVIREDFKEYVQNIKGLFAIPLVRTLAWINVPMWIVVHSLDYLFMLSMDEMIHDEDQLSAFLGSLNALISFSGILIQLIISRWLLRRIGVSFSYAIYSFTMNLGAVAMFLRGFFSAQVSGIWHPRHLFAIAARFLDEGVLNSIYDSSLQLLYNALPSRMRGQARAVITGALEPAMTALVGIFLIIITIMDVDPMHLALFCLLPGSIWIWMSLRIHGEYTESMVYSLGSKDPSQISRLSSQFQGRLRESALERLRSEMRENDPEKFAVVLEFIRQSQFDGKFDFLFDSLKYLSKENGIAVIQEIGNSGDASQAERLAMWLHHPDSDIQAAVVRAIGSCGHKALVKHFLYFFSHSAANVRGEAIYAWLRVLPESRFRKTAVACLEQLVKSRKVQPRLVACSVIRRLGNPEFLPLLQSLAISKNIAVRKAALRALGSVGNASSVPVLVQSLHDEDVYILSEASIINLGAQILDDLHQALFERHYSLKSRIRLIGCLGEIGLPESIDLLALLIRDEPLNLEDAAIFAIARIKRKHFDEEDLVHPDLQKDIRQIFATVNRKLAQDGVYIQVLESLDHNKRSVELLIDAIRRESLRREEILFACLEIFSHSRVVKAAYAGLRSGQKRDLAEAIELIEELGVEGQALSWTLELKYNKEKLLDTEVDLETILLDLLTQKQHDWLTACTLYACGVLQVADSSALVARFVHHRDVLVHENAMIASLQLGQKLTSRIRKSEVKKMESNMERILFLRSVPIFSGVDGNDLQWISEISRMTEIKPGQIIFHENETGDAMYIILEGRIRIVKGQNTTLDILLERDCFGEMAILDEEPRSATAVADGPCRLLAIQREDFQRLLMARPQIAIAMFRSISLRLRDLTRRVEQNPELIQPVKKAG
ncbi:MAG: HEAT repeat domain-containing protein [Leptospiraceae bacterium]|nr:HEAT repeat domain-containing protein [Leptospiraceae bacterium]